MGKRIMKSNVGIFYLFASIFRRALKATFVLIPLFGVHLVVTIYRMPPENPLYLHFERLSEVISNTQVSHVYHEIFLNTTVGSNVRN